MPVNGGLHAAQRFAADIVKLGPDGRLFDGPPDQVASYPGYGIPVLAVAAGVVVAAVDDKPDQVPFAAVPPVTPADIAGNHVVLDIGGGRYVFYAHLRPGSVRVSVGDRVRPGERVGQLGNSGNSDLPHLHLHVMDSPSPLGSDGLPYVLRSFDSPGRVPPLDQVDLTQPIPVGPELSGHHERVIPMNRQVVDYPAAR
jgi:murein DD-endopeptidase MepM/ murein hydrolase activator NlpD